MLYRSAVRVSARSAIQRLTSLSSPRTFPRFPLENEVRSGLSSGENGIRTRGPSRRKWGDASASKGNAKLKHPEPLEQFYVRLKAPAGIGAVQTFSGRHLKVKEDGTVEMSAEDATYLIPRGFIQAR